MAAISAIITEIRTDLNDDDSSRFTDTQILNIIKKAIRRANRIAQRNGLQFAKKKASLSTVASQDYVDISAAVSDMDVWIGLYRDDLHQEIKKKTEREWELIVSASAIANCLFDQANSKIYLNGTPSSVQTLTLWYYPTVDPSAYTTATSTPWSGRIDDIIAEYAGTRLKNIDEMDVSFEKQLLADLENQLLQAYAPNAPTVVEGTGWM
jgi:hypothetical protein